MNEFLEQFLIESRELAQQATTDLLRLEESPQDADILDSAFRAFHTLKGGAGIVDFAAMSQAVHAAESAAESGSGSPSRRWDESDSADHPIRDRVQAQKKGSFRIQ